MPSLRSPQAAASVLALAVTLTAALGVPGHSAAIHTGNGPTTTSHPTRPGRPGAATTTGVPAESIPAVDMPADTAQTATVTASRARLDKAARLADDRLDSALAQFIRRASAGTRPGITVVVQRGQSALTFRAGTAAPVGLAAVRVPDSLRLATVAYALSGAVALALVARTPARAEPDRRSLAPRPPARLAARHAAPAADPRQRHPRLRDGRGVPARAAHLAPERAGPAGAAGLRRQAPPVPARHAVCVLELRQRPGRADRPVGVRGAL